MALGVGFPIHGHLLRRVLLLDRRSRLLPGRQARAANARGRIAKAGHDVMDVGSGEGLYR